MTTKTKPNLLPPQATAMSPASEPPAGVDGARAAFEAAVLEGDTAIREYQAWAAAHKAAVADLSRRSSAAAREGEQRHRAYTQLMGEARALLSLIDSARVGSNANVGTSFASSTYTAEHHEQRLAAWLDRASAYAGRRIDTLDWQTRLTLPTPAAPFVAPLEHQAPPAYSDAVDRVLNAAATKQDTR